MKTSQDKTTQRWTRRDLETFQTLLIESRRMLEAFAEPLDAPCLLRKVPDEGAGDVEAQPLSGIVTVGREGDQPFAFPDDTSLSRRHFRVVVGENAMCYAEDLGSTNYLWINGQKVANRRLVHGDQIHAGSQDFVFHDGKAIEGKDVEL